MENYLGLVLLENEEDFYYVLIKELNKFMHNKTKHKEKNIFVLILYNVLSLKKHEQNIARFA